MSFYVILRYFFCCTLCTPIKIYILAKCETDKEPINPTGFPAHFAPMIIYCSIFTGIYSLCWYDHSVYCVWWETIKLFEYWILISLSPLNSIVARNNIYIYIMDRMYIYSSHPRIVSNQISYCQCRWMCVYTRCYIFIFMMLLEN